VGCHNILIGTNANVCANNFCNSIGFGNGVLVTASYQLAIGSAGVPIQTVATETLTPDRTLTILLNGASYKILMTKV
jgi:hypothetical protein